MPPDRPAPADSGPSPQEIPLHVKYDAPLYVVDSTANVRTIAARLLTDEEAHRLSPREGRVFAINGKFTDSPTLIAVTVTLRRELDRVLLEGAEGAEGALDLSVLRPPEPAGNTTVDYVPALRKAGSKPAEALPSPEVVAINIAIAAYLGDQARDGDENVRGFIERIYSNKEVGVTGWDPAEDIGKQLHLLTQVALKGKIANLIRALAFLRAQNVMQMGHKQYAIALLRHMAGEKTLKQWAEKALADLRADQPELFQTAAVETRIGGGKHISLNQVIARIIGTTEKPDTGNLAAIELGLPTLGSLLDQPMQQSYTAGEGEIAQLARLEGALDSATKGVGSRGKGDVNDTALIARLRSAASKGRLSLSGLRDQVKSRKEELQKRETRK
jgi:hypothetical protein